MTICERLFDELERRNLTAYGLCKAIGLNTSATTAWKKNGTDPPAKYIAKISEFLGCSLSYLLTGEETEQEREIKKEPSVGVSDRGRELLGYFNQLGEYEQGVLVGEARGLLLAAGGVGEKATG